MLRNTTRSYQKDQKVGILEPHCVTETLFNYSLYSKVPGMFGGFNGKNLESDSVKSPTSPLDLRIFSSFSKPIRCPVTPNQAHPKSWSCRKVGLSILDSPDDGNGDLTSFTDKKNIFFGREITVKGFDFGSQVISHQLPESSPDKVAIFPVAQAKKRNSDVVFEIGEVSAETDFRACSYDSTCIRLPSLVESQNKATRFGSRSLVSEIRSKPFEGFDMLDSNSSSNDNNISGATFICSGPVPATEMELSEDYTCVIAHGSHPKVTHIFSDHKVDDYVTDCNANNSILTGESELCALPTFPPEDMLKFCHYCNKKLDGEDIYMYRGEKAFCSQDCRSEAMKFDEDTELSEHDVSEAVDRKPKPNTSPVDVMTI